MPSGSLQAFLTELAHLDNLASYQRQATHAGQYGVAVKGGRVPTSDWMFNLHILTSGGCAWAEATLHHGMRWHGLFSVPLCVLHVVMQSSPHRGRFFKLIKLANNL